MAEECLLRELPGYTQKKLKNLKRPEIVKLLGLAAGDVNACGVADPTAAAPMGGCGPNSGIGSEIAGGRGGIADSPARVCNKSRPYAWPA